MYPKMLYGDRYLNNVFNNIYSKNYWEDKDSVSGRGSNLRQTAEIRKRLPVIIREKRIKTMLDIPCGDFYWLRKVNLGIQKYIGADIVESLIQENKKKYANKNFDFEVLDITSDHLPKVDLIFVRDCFVHLSYEEISKAIRKIKLSKSKFLLATTFPERNRNYDIITGFWRALNLQSPPFNFPEPLMLMNEKCSEGSGSFNDKSLGLWEINKL